MFKYLKNKLKNNKGFFGVDDALVISSALGAGAGIFGSLQEKAGAESANAMSYKIAKEQMAFQERMSSTAHQREVADLKAAGLNPILSVNAGASSPLGASAPIINPNAGMSEKFMHSASKLSEGLLNRLAAKKLDAEIDIAQSQADIAKNEKEISDSNKQNLIDFNKTGGKIKPWTDAFTRPIEAIGNLWPGKRFRVGGSAKDNGYYDPHPDKLRIIRRKD